MTVQTIPRDLIVRQGAAFTETLPYAGVAGRGQRMHIRTATSAATVVRILSHNGDANSRVIFDGSDSIVVTIGASISALWLVGADRVEWVYDIEDYSLSDVDDVEIPYSGKVIVYGNRTRADDVTPSPQMPSGDGRYVRFDGEQTLTTEQKLQARTNIGAGSGGSGSGDVAGPASATDDRIAAFDGTTGKLIKQGSVTATAVASHLSSTSNPHSVTAAQVGADAAGTAATAVGALAATLGTAATKNVGTTAGTVAAGDDARLSDAREPTAHNQDANTITTGTLDAARLPAPGTATLGGVKRNTGSAGQFVTGVDTDGSLLRDTPAGASPAGSDTQPQYNAAGSFAGMAGVAWDNTNRAETRTGATVTTSNPVQSFTQTWNGGAVAFTGWLLNITNTASAAASRLFDLQLAGTSMAHFSREGGLRAGGVGTGLAGYSTYTQDGGGNPQIFRGASVVVNFASGCQLGNTGYFGFASAFAPSEGGQDVSLYRDAAGVLAQRRTTNAQTFRVYGTWTDASNYVRGSLAATSTAVTLTAETAGTGADDVPLTLTAGGVAHVISGSPLRLPSFTVAALPSAATAAALIYVSNESGGAVLAFSDGTNWRRVTDRAIVS